MKNIHIIVAMKHWWILLLFISTITFGQKVGKYYDYNWKETDGAGASFYSVVEKTDSGWYRLDYFAQSRKLQMEGLYQDESCKISNGHFKYYHANGMPESAGRYLNNKREGVWLHYHSNGYIADSGYYEKGEEVGICKSWHRNGFPADSAIYDRNGGGVHCSWFNNGNPSSAGRYLSGKKQGLWQYFHKNGVQSAEEVYKQDVCISKQYFDTNGHPMDTAVVSVAGKKETRKSLEWSKYLSDRLYFPSHLRIENAERVALVVEFVIDEEGGVTDPVVTVPLHPELDAIAIKVISGSPRWTPARSHNRNIRYKQRQPVFFRQQVEE